MRTTVRQALGRSKSVDAPVLNRLGLQVARTLGASARFHAARWPVDPEVADAVAALRADGCAVIEGLFEPEVLDRLEAVAARVDADPDIAHDDNPQGANRLRVTWRADVPDDDRAVLDEFFLHPRIRALGEAAERLALDPGAGRCTVQHLVQAEGEPDLEAQLHSDTFHPTHKIWLYLTDVTEDDGPLLFYPGSQKLSLASLRGTYADSVADNVGARRVPPEEVRARHLEPKVFTCRRGTVVVANTIGYHGRVQGRPPGQRLVLHVELRPDPFRRPRRIEADTSTARDR